MRMIVFGEAVIESFFRLVLNALVSYVALWIVDTLRPVDVSWRRRLLFVALSVPFMVSVDSLNVVLSFVLFFVIVWVLLRWIYSESWKDAAIRVVLWYALSVLFVMVIVMVGALFSLLFA